jgi:ABC-2 type transport system permease protein
MEKKIIDKKVSSVSKKKRIKRNNLFALFLSLLIIILVNVIGNYVFTRFDLTTEKRYTLSDATRKFLKNVDDVVYFQVYLEGDFPASFKRLRNATREMLDEFRAYNDNIQYKFINPSEGKDKKAVQSLYKQLMQKGLEPTELNQNTTEGMSQQVIFPGAIVSYKGKEMPLQLLMSQQGTPPEQVLNNSIQGLEYNMANVIRKLSVGTKQRIAFLQGHGELDKLRLADISYSLSDYYAIDFVTIDGKLNSLSIRDSAKKELINKYQAIIIAKPDSAFPEKDKYMIDQFIMRGGKVIWLIDPVFASMDSLQAHNETVGFARSLNLEDMLFQYGVRINTNLILDMSCVKIPVVTGDYGGQPQQNFLPWYYFPTVLPTINHPIVNNLNAIRCEFVSSIDTVGDRDIKKTILLSTSKYSRPVNTPCRISLDLLSEKLDEKFFNKPYKSIAVLLEGNFKSVFLNRLPLDIMQDKEKYDYRPESKANKMIVISDGDIIKNQLHYSKGYPLPLGYDQYTNEMYGNKDFILNAIDYLCDESGLITVRSRELKLRLLDKTKIAKSKLAIQLFNTAIPIIVVLLFGVGWIMIRRRIFTRVKKH